MTTRDDRIPQFDGLRAFAFLAVFIHHALGTPLLWMGVDQFFVLSGFLITRNLLQLRARVSTGSALSTFFYRRLLRIVPPYYLALTLIYILSPVPRGEAMWFFGFASNIRDSIYHPLSGPLNTMWSIAVEEQFYLVWPWLVLLLPRRRFMTAFFVVIVSAVFFRLGFATTAGLDAVYRLMPCRMDLLAGGAALALVESRDSTWLPNRRRLFAWAIISCGLAFALLSVMRPTFRRESVSPMFVVVGFGLSTLAFTSTLAYIRVCDGLVWRVLTNPICRYVGQVSYMAYLTHRLAIQLTREGGLGLGRPASTVLALALTLLISTVSWYGLERPLQRLRRFVRPRASAPPVPSTA